MTCLQCLRWKFNVRMQWKWRQKAAESLPLIFGGNKIPSTSNQDYVRRGTSKVSVTFKGGLTAIYAILRLR